VGRLGCGARSAVQPSLGSSPGREHAGSHLPHPGGRTGKTSRLSREFRLAGRAGDHGPARAYGHGAVRAGDAPGRSAAGSVAAAHGVALPRRTPRTVIAARSARPRRSGRFEERLERTRTVPDGSAFPRPPARLGATFRTAAPHRGHQDGRSLRPLGPSGAGAIADHVYRSALFGFRRQGRFLPHPLWQSRGRRSQTHPHARSGAVRLLLARQVPVNRTGGRTAGAWGDFALAHPQ
jgi:hypothetical protein